MYTSVLGVLRAVQAKRPITSEKHLAHEPDGTSRYCPLSYEIHVFYTDDSGIRGINRERRGVDNPTDVLSFPMLPCRPGKGPSAPLGAIDRETDRLFLGDILISLPRAREQARCYRHSPAREICYLTVHGVLHLLGYDHERAWDRAIMRAEEERILSGIKLMRCRGVLRFRKRERGYGS